MSIQFANAVANDSAAAATTTATTTAANASPSRDTAPTSDPAPAPVIPAHVWELITPLTTLLDRVLAVSPVAAGGSGSGPGPGLGLGSGPEGLDAVLPTGVTSTSAAATSVEATLPGAPGQPVPLALKDLQAEVLRIKHAAAAARTQLRGLPDLERTIAEQQTEFITLQQQLARARSVRQGMETLASTAANAAAPNPTNSAEDAAMTG